MITIYKYSFHPCTHIHTLIVTAHHKHSSEVRASPVTTLLLFGLVLALVMVGVSISVVIAFTIKFKFTCRMIATVQPDQGIYCMLFCVVGYRHLFL